MTNGQEQAYELACQQPASRNIEELCRKTGAQAVDSSKITVEYLDQAYLVTLPNGEVSSWNNDEEVPLKDKILILHYLVSARGTPPSNRLITFKQLPGCASYFRVFSQMALKPFLDHFGEEPLLLINAGANLGGHKAGYGDVSITINALPRVPISFALWRGDDEFSPRGSIIFDSSSSDFLPTEDIRDICVKYPVEVNQKLTLSNTTASKRLLRHIDAVPAKTWLPHVRKPAILNLPGPWT